MMFAGRIGPSREPRVWDRWAALNNNDHQLKTANSFTKKWQSQTVIIEKLHKVLLYKKGARKMLMFFNEP